MADSQFDTKPHEDDLRFDDEDYNPAAAEPDRKATAWLNLIRESEEAFEQWNTHCDNIDKQFANLQRLSNNSRDREFQMFWANCEVLKPSIYAKPPVPVVVPKFKDRRPVYQAASEVMERCCVVAFDLTRINDLMLLVRDDLSMYSRGVAWLRYEGAGGDGYYDTERVCIDFKGRRDFVHSIARNWREVTWVAGASYMTRGEARKRFYPHSGTAYQDAEYKSDKDAIEVGGADYRERAKFWEIWYKGGKKVLWVSEGCEDILDEADPHLELQNFFPCPKPAYGTVQMGSLVPVPDVLQYKDQLDEINMLTGRIHALSDAIKVKGFYPAGGGELAEAIQTAIKMNSDGETLVPISNWAAFGGSKDIIFYWPIDMIAQTVTSLVALRKEVISDIYQIMGLSDIMRGATDPNETLGAQQLKTQYGSTRIRDKQQEMVRIARDMVEIASEIITERFDRKTMIEMSQTQLPTERMQNQKAQQIIAEVEKMREMVEQAKQIGPPQPQDPSQPPDQQQDPTAQIGQQYEQAKQQAISQLKKMDQEPTIEQVFDFLEDNRAKSFVLDIETDSTILADENAEKQRRTEFATALGGLLQQASQIMQTDPSMAPFLGDVIKFTLAPYRAGRSLDNSLDEMIENQKKKSEGGQPDDPATAQAKVALQIEQMKQDTAKAKNQQDLQVKQAELAQKDKHHQDEIDSKQRIALAELQVKRGDRQQEAQMANQEQIHDRETHQLELVKKQADIQVAAQKAQTAAQLAQFKQQDMAARRSDQQADMQFKQQDREQQSRMKQQDMQARQAERASSQQFRQRQATQIRARPF